MRHNPHKGSVFVVIDGDEIEIRFSWESLSALHGLLGKEWEDEFARICTEMDTRGLSQVLGISTDHTAEWWLDKSPPLIPIAQATRQALTLAFFGAGGLESKNPLMVLHRMISSLRLGRRGSALEDQGTTSGA